MTPYGVMQGTMMKMKKNTGVGDFSPTPKSGKNLAYSEKCMRILRLFEKKRVILHAKFQNKTK
jgi:hypothetical protein